jgi:hypothetical protein
VNGQGTVPDFLADPRLEAQADPQANTTCQDIERPDVVVVSLGHHVDVIANDAAAAPQNDPSVVRHPVDRNAMTRATAMGMRRKRDGTVKDLGMGTRVRWPRGPGCARRSR